MNQININCRMRGENHYLTWNLSSAHNPKRSTSRTHHQPTTHKVSARACYWDSQHTLGEWPYHQYWPWYSHSPIPYCILHSGYCIPSLRYLCLPTLASRHHAGRKMYSELWLMMDLTTRKAVSVSDASNRANKAWRTFYLPRKTSQNDSHSVLNDILWNIPYIPKNCWVMNLAYLILMVALSLMISWVTFCT